MKPNILKLAAVFYKLSQAKPLDAKQLQDFLVSNKLHFSPPYPKEIEDLMLRLIEQLETWYLAIKRSQGDIFQFKKEIENIRQELAKHKRKNYLTPEQVKEKEARINQINEVEIPAVVKASEELIKKFEGFPKSVELQLIINPEGRVAVKGNLRALADSLEAAGNRKDATALKQYLVKILMKTRELAVKNKPVDMIYYNMPVSLISSEMI